MKGMGKSQWLKKKVLTIDGFVLFTIESNLNEMFYFVHRCKSGICFTTEAKDLPQIVHFFKILLQVLSVLFQMIAKHSWK